MTEQAISPLRRRMIEDMSIRKFQPNPRQQHRAYPRAARSAAHPDRGHQGCPHKVRRAESARACLSLLRRPHAHHRDLLAGATAKASLHPASATDQDRHFMMAISELPPRKSRPSVAAFLSWPWLSSLQYCPHHATAVPIFSDTPTADQKTALPPRCNAIFHRSSHRAADRSSGPPTAKSP